jgi:hypothetical protein
LFGKSWAEREEAPVNNFGEKVHAKFKSLEGGRV